MTLRERPLSANLRKTGGDMYSIYLLYTAHLCCVCLTHVHVVLYLPMLSNGTDLSLMSENACVWFKVLA
jgi:hypothetical protein